MIKTYSEYKQQGYNFFIGVPCSGIKDFIKDIISDPAHRYVPATREDEAVAIAFGAYLTGKKPLVFLQNAGLGHIVNIMTSLVKAYGNVPIKFIISKRTKPFEHEYMASITEPLANMLGLDYDVMVQE